MSTMYGSDGFYQTGRSKKVRVGGTWEMRGAQGGCKAVCNITSHPLVMEALFLWSRIRREVLNGTWGTRHEKDEAPRGKNQELFLSPQGGRADIS